MRHPIDIDLTSFPKVLLVGNGVLRLGESISWSDLLKEIKTRSDKEYKLESVPMAMQPECICGVDVDEVQRRTANIIRDSQPDESGFLKRLVSLPFDAILTTNYTYEIEKELTGKPWSDQARRKTFIALDGNTHVRNNTCVCNLITTEDDREIPVFHIHGEKLRKHSLILSYYSYANAVSRLISLNKHRGNTYQEKQEINEKLSCLSWLDYFVMGDVYSVGFGFDTSEFDIWWAIERKARENAKHGGLHAYMITNEESNSPQQALFAAMDVYTKQFVVENGCYLTAYEKVFKEIAKKIQK